jgi:hypothetical protein
MARQTVPDMKELFRQAAEIAQQVPESMHEAAFNRALDLLVGESAEKKPKVPVKTKPKSHTRRGGKSVGGSAIETLLEQIDSTQHPGTRSATKVLDRSLMVLQIALRDHSVDGLTPSEVARILTQKFRLSTTRQAVGMALKDASNLVDRITEGAGYRYRIMGPGEEYLAHHEGADSDAEAGQRVKKAAKRRSKKLRADSVTSAGPTDTTSTNNTENTKSTKRTGAKRLTPSQKIGPKASIASLIESGFFSTAKTGPEVQDYLKKKRGFDLGTDQLRLAMLRLVRDGVLERDNNDEGQYEYKRP